MSNDKAIPQGSTVLVTGAAGLAGAAVSHELLKAGYKVRAAARTVAKAEPLKKKFDAEFGEGAFQVVHVPDFAKPGAYDEAIEGVSGVVHVAADLSFSQDAEYVINSTIHGILNILIPASKTPSVRRVVLTSSRIATFNPNKGDDYTVDNASFNDVIVKSARESGPENPMRGFFVYAAGKVEGEKTAWKWYEENKPSFVLNTVLPDLIVGEIINPNSEGSTAGLVNDIYTKGDFSRVGFAIHPSFYVDVYDVGRIHLLALTEPDVKNERLWALAAPFTLNEICEIWREAFPDNKNIPENREGYGEPTKIKVDNSRETKLLQRLGRPGWVSLKESLLAQVKGL